jgi:hypothetical protein
MTRFTDRVERDLSQISDRATPSSTAWEAIRHRIDEQDTQPTMEVIMLDPDTNTLAKKRPTGLLVAASIAAVAVVGALVVVANRDGESPPLDRPEPTPTVVATDPAIAGDPAVDENVGDAEATEAEVLAAVDPPGQGLFVPTCTTGAASEDPSNARLVVVQECNISGVDAQPFAADQILELSLLEEVGAVNSPAGAFISLGDNGFMNAGLLWDDGTKGRWVGIAEGIDDYEGRPVFLSAVSSQNDDGSLDELDGRWWTDDGPRPDFDGVEVTAEISFVCENVPADDGSNDIGLTAAVPGAIMCTYAGDDPNLVPDPERFSTTVVPAAFADESPGEGPGPVAFSDFLFGVSDDGGVVRAGLITNGAEIRWSGMRLGTSDDEEQLVAENGWAEFEDPGSETSAVTGVIQLTVLPADG